MIDVLDGQAMYDKVDALRQEKGWTLYELSKKAGLSPMTLYHWRDNKSIPSFPIMEAVCSALGITLVEFLLDDDDNNKQFTDEQLYIVNLWNSLTPDQKKSVISVMKSMIREN